MIDIIYNENCLNTMPRMPDNFIDLTVTSPPYDNLRDYKGYSFDFESIAKELFRVTKLGGVVVWVVGDATIKGSETGTSFRQALYFKEIGFHLHDTMIYSKKYPVPSGPRKRYWQQFEYMFVLTKSNPTTFNAIQEKCKQTGRIPYSKFRYPDGSTKLQNSIKPVKETKVKGNVWLYDVGYMKSTRDKIAFQIPAIFPERLVEDHIVSWSNEGDVVYDPLAGSGTTGIMAFKNKRNFILSEISKEYCDIISKRFLDRFNVNIDVVK